MDNRDYLAMNQENVIDNKIKKGDKFLCIEDYIMKDGEVAFVKDQTYQSHNTNYMKNEQGYKYHHMSTESNFDKYFKRVTETPEQDITLSHKQLLLLLKEAYRNGYATYEMAEAGLESYDAEGYARWVLLGLK